MLEELNNIGWGLYQIALFLIKNNLKFIKSQEASGLLNKLGTSTPLSNITSMGDILS